MEEIFHDNNNTLKTYCIRCMLAFVKERYVLALIHHSFLMFVVDIGLSSLQVHCLQCLSKCVHFRILVISDILEVCYSAY